MNNKKKISIVTPTFNEEGNILELYSRVKKVLHKLSSKYSYEHIVIDNCSSDKTQTILKKLCSEDKNLKCIFNTRNFGYIRSSYYGFINASGSAVILISSDLQDPPEMIEEYIRLWEKGFDVVLGTKPQSEEFFLMKNLRKLFYRSLQSISEVPLENDATGSGLYDQKVVKEIRKIKDPYPYLRGLVCDLGFRRTTLEFKQPKRKKGKTSTNFYILLDQALQAVTKHSKVPIRALTILGIIISLSSISVSIVYFVLKLIYWDSFSLGVAPILISLFFFFGLLFFFLGIIGEYLGMVLTHIRNLPHVVEDERINF